MWAVLKLNLSIVTELIRRGADISLRDNVSTIDEILLHKRPVIWYDVMIVHL